MMRITLKESNPDWIQNIFCPDSNYKITELKFDNFQALYTLSEDSLNRIHDSEGLEIKISNGVSQELTARVLRVLAGKIDLTRHNRSRAFNGHAW